MNIQGENDDNPADKVKKRGLPSDPHSEQPPWHGSPVKRNFMILPTCYVLLEDKCMKNLDLFVARPKLAGSCPVWRRRLSHYDAKEERAVAQAQPRANPGPLLLYDVLVDSREECFSHRAGGIRSAIADEMLIDSTKLPCFTIRCYPSWVSNSGLTEEQSRLSARLS